MTDTTTNLMIFFEDALNIELANDPSAVRFYRDTTPDDHIVYEFRIKTAEGKRYTTGPIAVYPAEFICESIGEYLADVAVKYLRADMRKN